MCNSSLKRILVWFQHCMIADQRIIPLNNFGGCNHVNLFGHSGCGHRACDILRCVSPFPHGGELIISGLAAGLPMKCLVAAELKT